MMTFVNVFRSCNQDSCTVFSIMSDVLRQFKEAQPQMKNIYFLQDKTMLAATIVVQRLLEQDLLANNMKFQWRRWISGIRKQVKGARDRKAATVKSHMKIFLTSGNNIERAEEMRDAILSSGGLPSVNVTVSGDRDVPSHHVGRCHRCFKQRVYWRRVNMESLYNWSCEIEGNFSTLQIRMLLFWRLITTKTQFSNLIGS